MLEISDMIRAIKYVRETKGFLTLHAYNSCDSSVENEYCLFIKPELTSLGDRFEEVAALIMDRLTGLNQFPVAAAVMEASYITRHNIMSQHYGVIDTVARRGSDVISEAAKLRLDQVFGDDLRFGLVVLGAYEFLDRFRYFNAQSLAVLYDNMQNVKLAGGTHCVRAVVRGLPVLVFNGFYPEQLELYTEVGAAILVLVLRTDVSWKVLRASMTGATNPAKAAPESIRGMLLSNKDRLGLEEVSSGKNGVHVSAGPVEGMVEISRFMSDRDQDRLLSAEETCFGRLLLESGSDVAFVRELCSNPEISFDGSMVPVFDLTEELDSVVARDRLLRA